MANLMGFKRVSKMPSPKGSSIYDGLLDEVRKTGGYYVLDTQDKRRAVNLATTLRAVIKKRGDDSLKAGLSGTVVYVTKK